MDCCLEFPCYFCLQNLVLHMFKCFCKNNFIFGISSYLWPSLCWTSASVDLLAMQGEELVALMVGLGGL